MANIDDIKKTLEEGVSIAREGVAYAAERAEDLSRAAALRLRIFALRRRIERYYTELGETVHGLSRKKGDVWSDAVVKRHLRNIAAQESESDKLFAELDGASRAEAKGTKKAGPTAAKKRSGKQGRRRKAGPKKNA
jgi:hypothetical protein